MAIAGLTTLPIRFDTVGTIDRLEQAIVARGMTVFARIDHAAGAAAVGLELRATTVLIFGNARGGTPLMQAEQTIGIDLPLKMLVHQDAGGNVLVSYNDPAWLAHRHGIDALPVIGAMTAMLTAIAATAIGQPGP